MTVLERICRHQFRHDWGPHASQMWGTQERNHIADRFRKILLAQAEAFVERPDIAEAFRQAAAEDENGWGPWDESVFVKGEG